MEIKRNIIKDLYEALGAKEISILIGARQVGKTFLLRKVEAQAKKSGLTTKYFDLEIPSDIIKFNRSEAEVFRLLTTAAQVVLIDEFHYLKNASHLFKAIYDSKQSTKIFASGSSSLEIHKHLKESLAGRKTIYKIFPCTYSEIASVKKEATIEYYLTYGGLPGLIQKRDDKQKKELLQDILQSYLLKDIKSLIKEENIRSFNSLLYLLAQNQGNLISAASFSQEIGLTARTIESYLEILSQTFVSYQIHSFNTNLGNELKKSRKCYLYDLGIRNILLKDFRPYNRRPDAGPIIESFAFLELAKQITPEVELRFWRTRRGDEVDFIWLQNRVPYPIEVKTADYTNKIPKGLKLFLKRYPKTKECFILHGGKSCEQITDNAVFHYRHWSQASLIPTIIKNTLT